MSKKSPPMTYAEIIRFYGSLKENPPASHYQAGNPVDCRDCGRPIILRQRWKGGWAKIEAYPAADAELGYLETSPGSFIRVFHHDCPGKETDAEAKERRRKKREEEGIREPGEKPAKKPDKKGQFGLF